MNSTKLNSKTIDHTIVKSNPQSESSHKIVFDPINDSEPYISKEEDLSSLFNNLKSNDVISSVPLHVLIE